MVVSDGPVEKVLEGTGQGAGVLWHGEQDRIRSVEGPPKVSDGPRWRGRVIVGIERREVVDAVIDDGIDAT